jgi:hypothetical protein
MTASFRNYELQKSPSFTELPFILINKLKLLEICCLLCPSDANEGQGF